MGGGKEGTLFCACCLVFEANRGRGHRSATLKKLKHMLFSCCPTHLFSFPAARFCCPFLLPVSAARFCWAAFRAVDPHQVAQLLPAIRPRVGDRLAGPRGSGGPGQGAHGPPGGGTRQVHRRSSLLPPPPLATPALFITRPLLASPLSSVPVLCTPIHAEAENAEEAQMFFHAVPVVSCLYVSMSTYCLLAYCGNNWPHIV